MANIGLFQCDPWWLSTRNWLQVATNDISIQEFDMSCHTITHISLYHFFSWTVEKCSQPGLTTTFYKRPLFSTFEHFYFARDSVMINHEMFYQKAPLKPMCCFIYILESSNSSSFTFDLISSLLALEATEPLSEPLTQMVLELLNNHPISV